MILNSNIDRIAAAAVIAHDALQCSTTWCNITAVLALSKALPLPTSHPHLRQPLEDTVARLAPALVGTERLLDQGLGSGMGRLKGPLQHL